MIPQEEIETLKEIKIWFEKNAKNYYAAVEAQEELVLQLSIEGYPKTKQGLWDLAKYCLYAVEFDYPDAP